MPRQTRSSSRSRSRQRKRVLGRIGIGAAVLASLALVAVVVISVSSALQRPTYSDEYIAQANERLSEERAREQADSQPTQLELPPSPRVLMLGDSYMEGTGATDPASTAWAPQTASALGWQATIDGVGGTGFTVGTPTDPAARFVDRIRGHAGASFDLVFLEGGQNDHAASPEELSSAVREALELVESQWPEAQVIVMGPVAPQPLGDMLGRMADPIARQAVALNAFAMNPIRGGWITAANSPDLDFDGAHVNQAGHDLIAQRVTDQVNTWSATR